MTDPMIPRVAGLDDEVYDRLTTAELPELEVTSNRRFDLGAGLVILISLVTSIVVVMSTLNASSDTEAIKASDDVAGCRAALRSDLDSANLAYQVADGQVDNLLFDAIVARAQGNDAQVLVLAQQAIAAREAKADALVRIDKAVKAYDVAATESLEDPAGFVASCKERK